MKLSLEQLKTLVEDGDITAVEKYILDGIDRNDVKAVSATNEDVKSYMDSVKDTHFTTALETWKRNNLDKLVDDKVKEINPELTEEQKRIAALEKKIEERETEYNRERFKNKALSVLNEKGLPTDLVDYFVADSEEKTLENLTKFEEVHGSSVQKAVESKFKENGRDIRNSTGKSAPPVESFGDLAAKNNIRNQ